MSPAATSPKASADGRVIKIVLGLRKDIPIIINTAYQSYKEDFMTWAADAYVVKSSSLQELKSKIKELLNR